MFTTQSLKAKVKPLTRKEVAFLGDTVLLTELGARSRVRLFAGREADAMDGVGKLSLACALLAESAISDDGTPLMDAAGWEKLFDGDAESVMALAVESLTLNKMTEDAINDTVGNSEASRN